MHWHSKIHATKTNPKPAKNNKDQPPACTEYKPELKLSTTREKEQNIKNKTTKEPWKAEHHTNKRCTRHPNCMDPGSPQTGRSKVGANTTRFKNLVLGVSKDYNTRI